MLGKVPVMYDIYQKMNKGFSVGLPIYTSMIPDKFGCKKVSLR